MKLAFMCTKLRHDLALASREPFHMIRPFNIAETWMANASRQQGVFPRGLNNHRACSLLLRLRVVIHCIYSTFVGFKHWALFVPNCFP